METGVQEVYWGALLGWTPDEEGRGQNRKRERSGRKAVTVKASANFMRSSGTRKTLQTTNQKDILPNLTILKLIR